MTQAETRPTDPVYSTVKLPAAHVKRILKLSNEMMRKQYPISRIHCPVCLGDIDELSIDGRLNHVEKCVLDVVNAD